MLLNGLKRGVSIAIRSLLEAGSSFTWEARDKEADGRGDIERRGLYILSRRYWEVRGGHI